MKKTPPNYQNQQRTIDGRWIAKIGIGKKIHPMSVKLPETLDGIVRSLSEEKLLELCGSRDRSAYLRLAIVNQLQRDGLLPENQDANPSSDLGTHTRKRKTATQHAV